MDSCDEARERAKEEIRKRDEEFRKRATMAVRRVKEVGIYQVWVELELEAGHPLIVEAITVLAVPEAWTFEQGCKILIRFLGLSERIASGCLYETVHGKFLRFIWPLWWPRAPDHNKEWLGMEKKARKFFLARAKDVFGDKLEELYGTLKQEGIPFSR